MYLHLIDSNGVFQTHNLWIMRHVVFDHSTSIAVHSSLISFIGESRKGKFDARLQQKFRFLPFLINVHPFVSFFFGAKNGESVFLLEKNSFRCEIFRKMLFRRTRSIIFFQASAASAANVISHCYLWLLHWIPRAAKVDGTQEELLLLKISSVRKK